MRRNVVVCSVLFVGLVAMGCSGNGNSNPSGHQFGQVEPSKWEKKLDRRYEGRNAAGPSGSSTATANKEEKEKSGGSNSSSGKSGPSGTPWSYLFTAAALGIVFWGGKKVRELEWGGGLIRLAVGFVALGFIWKPLGMNLSFFPHANWLWGVGAAVVWLLCKVIPGKLDDRLLLLASLVLAGFSVFSGWSLWWIVLATWLGALAPAIEEEFETQGLHRFLCLLPGWYALCVLAPDFPILSWLGL